MSWKFATTVVGDIDHSTLAWLDGSLGVGGNRASAAGKCLMNDQRGCANVGEFERTVDNRVFLAEFPKVMAEGVELDFSIVFSLGGSLGFHLTGDDLLLLGLCADADGEFIGRACMG